jgi:glucuronate isomerase
MISMLVATFLSCQIHIGTTFESDPNIKIVCGTKDPLNDLKWLSEEMKLLTEGPKLNGIILFEYKSNQVIEIQCSGCSYLNTHQYYCDGTKLDFANLNNFRNYRPNRKKVKILYGTEIW